MRSKWDVASTFFKIIFRCYIVLTYYKSRFSPTKVLSLAFIFLFSISLHAMNGLTTYQAKIYKPDGYPLEESNVSFKFSVFDGTASCVLYSETYTAVDMRSSGGLISFALGNGTRTFPASGTTTVFANVFDNTIVSMPCETSGIYNPSPADTRKIVMQFNDGNGWQSTPAMTINAIPYAMYANKSINSKRLNGKLDTDFVEYSSLASLNCQSNEAIKFNGVSFSCIAVGSGGGGIASVTTSGTVLVTAGTASAPVISAQMVTVSQDGYLTSSDYVEFKNKLSASSTQIISVLGYTPASNTNLNTLSGTVSTLGSTVSSLQSQISSPIDLGTASATGTLAIARLPAFTGDASIAAASNTIILSNTGVIAGNYQNVTVDAKGRVTSGSMLSSNDITTALGYTPAASGSISSQWTTSGTTINYVNGNVGIGTPNPAEKLEIDGNIRLKGNSRRFLAPMGSAAPADLIFQSDVTNSNTYLSAMPTGSNTIAQLRLYGTSDPNNAPIGVFGITNTALQIAAAKSGTGLFLPIEFRTSGIERMRIDTSGNVGIGTTNPTASLEVTGTIKITGGTPGLGKVLTSDANGLASWQTASAGSSGTVMSVSSGNSYISIVSSTTTPQLTLNVGTTSNTVAAGNDSRIVNALSQTSFNSYVSSASCGVSQTMYWNSVGGTFACSGISTLNASVISAGTFDAARLPAAASNADGIVNQSAQSFSGVKTFINNVIMNAALSVAGALSAGSAAITGAVTAGSFSTTGVINASGTITTTNAVAVSASSGLGSFNRIKLANSAVTCNASEEGSVKYNSVTKQMEFCNGTQWTSLSQNDAVSIVFSPSPSPMRVASSGVITYGVFYGSGTDQSTINLVSGKINFSGTSAGCSVQSITGSDGQQRMVYITGCTGTGNMTLNIVSQTAQSNSGNQAPSANAPAVQIDNSGPNAPATPTLGSETFNYTDTPTITLGGAVTDVGGGTVASYQARVVRTDNSSVIKDWTTFISGQQLTGMLLSKGVNYSIFVRGVDDLGNLGTQSSIAASFTVTAVDCPDQSGAGGYGNYNDYNPGDVCNAQGGVQILGKLSPGATSGSGTNYYMTTPGGCGQIPVAQQANPASGTAAIYPNGDFTPTCTNGTDSLAKHWNNGTASFYDIPALTNYTTTYGTGYGATNIDQNYGSANTTAIVSISPSATANGGAHAAARYCDKLVYGGYDDWYLPNRYELNLMFTNKTAIRGLNTGGTYYWSSTEYSSVVAWIQRFSDGYQAETGAKSNGGLVRCVRRF